MINVKQLYTYHILGTVGIICNIIQKQLNKEGLKSLVALYGLPVSKGYGNSV